MKKFLFWIANSCEGIMAISILLLFVATGSFIWGYIYICLGSMILGLILMLLLQYSIKYKNNKLRRIRK